MMYCMMFMGMICMSTLMKFWTTFGESYDIESPILWIIMKQLLSQGQTGKITFLSLFVSFSQVKIPINTFRNE